MATGTSMFFRRLMTLAMLSMRERFRGMKTRMDREPLAQSGRFILTFTVLVPFLHRT